MSWNEYRYLKVFDWHPDEGFELNAGSLFLWYEEWDGAVVHVLENVSTNDTWWYEMERVDMKDGDIYCDIYRSGVDIYFNDPEDYYWYLQTDTGRYGYTCMETTSEVANIGDEVNFPRENMAMRYDGDVVYMLANMDSTYTDYTLKYDEVNPDDTIWLYDAHAGVNGYKDWWDGKINFTWLQYS